MNAAQDLIHSITHNPVLVALRWIGDTLDHMTLLDLAMLLFAAFALYLAAISLYDILIAEPRRVAKAKKNSRTHRRN